MALFQDLETPNGHMYRQPLGLFINNEFVQSIEGGTIPSIDPATEELITSVQSASGRDVDAAVSAAQEALVHPSWKLLSSTDRGKLLAKLADLVEGQMELLASIEAWDTGKPYRVTVNEDIPEAVSVLRYYAGWCDKIHGKTISTTVDKFAYTIRQPVGVVGQIIPWNYPLSTATWKLAPALACGNTIVLKASELTPLSILMLGQLIKLAGFPPGVVNLLNGVGSEAGSRLVEHPHVDKISFTGSTATAKAIMSAAAVNLKKITLEAGGKSALLVFDDADLDQAVRWSHFGVMSNQGQICSATSRILVQRTIYKNFIERFIKTVQETSKVGVQWDDATYQGPQASKSQYDKIISYIETGQAEGATLVLGGKPCLVKGKGYFISPAVFADVTDSMRIYQEEIFGPVAVIAAFDSEDEAITKANCSSYGLAAAIFTRDVKRAHRLSAEVEAGTVWINSSQDIDFRVPFGGVKQSGFGRELGKAALEAYSQIKAVHVNMGADI
ncbi:retinal dehydrogenase 2 [Pochonia chlamydosporia 170]|uniref:Retinal dehydrogenase 2 n=1 Tax=Pochonia chlamydosporia 170 TaxID=1380566 RepID=A0A179G181_METCM|nr:retinal dehydrogenase 2 [Pochonia chlamydosporia 170]OAQ71447.1 retinal dehydrogenase 2 [Pochonia chlamydosporia 170]